MVTAVTGTVNDSLVVELPAYHTHQEMPLVIPASHIRQLLGVPAAPLPSQCPPNVPGKASEDGPRAWGPCHPYGRTQAFIWLSSGFHLAPHWLLQLFGE